MWPTELRTNDRPTDERPYDGPTERPNSPSNEILIIQRRLNLFTRRQQTETVALLGPQRSELQQLADLNAAVGWQSVCPFKGSIHAGEIHNVEGLNLPLAFGERPALHRLVERVPEAVPSWVPNSGCCLTYSHASLGTFSRALRWPRWSPMWHRHPGNRGPTATGRWLVPQRPGWRLMLPSLWMLLGWRPSALGQGFWRYQQRTEGCSVAYGELRIYLVQCVIDGAD